jgi:hypothetical protein
MKLHRLKVPAAAPMERRLDAIRTASDLDAIADELNDRPRKRLLVVPLPTEGIDPLRFR